MVLVFIRNLSIDFFTFERVKLFAILILIGGIVLVINGVVAKYVKNISLNRIMQ
jgi:hypothetical protein